MRTIYFIILMAIMSNASNAQSIINPDGDTIIQINSNGIISDVSGNYMGKFENDGSVYNMHNYFIGRIDISTGKIYAANNDEVAYLSNNQVTLIDNSILCTINNNSVYGLQSNLLGSYVSLDPIKAVFLLAFYY